jgi:hypothetical protein
MITATEQQDQPTATEIAVRALAIWKRQWMPQEFQPYYLEQAKDELLAEQFLESDERAIDA